LRSSSHTIFSSTVPAQQILKSGRIIHKSGKMSNVCPELEFLPICSKIDDSMVLDAEGENMKNGTNLILYPFHGGANQFWGYDGTYIRCKKDPKFVIDVAGCDIKLSANLHLWECNGSDAQKWDFDGTVFKLRKNPDYVIDLRSSKAEAGNNIQLWQSNNTSAQRWRHGLPYHAVKKAERKQEIIAETEFKVMKEKRSLFHKSRNTEDCEELLRDLIFKKTERWVEDEDLHRKDVNNLVAKLTPEILNAYRKYKEDKIAAFTDNLRNRVMMEKREIISSSDSTAKCVELLEEKIDKTALFLQDKDPSIGEQPLGAILKIKSELVAKLTPEFLNAYRKYKEDKIAAFTDNLRNRVMMEKREIISSSDSTAKCVELLEEKIDKTALFLQDKDPSIGEQPLGAILKIKSELATIFKTERERHKKENDNIFQTMESSSLTRETKELKGGVDVTAVANTFGEAMIRVIMDSLSGGAAEVAKLIKDRLVNNVEHLCVEAYHSKKNSWERSAKVVYDDQNEEHILVLFRLDSYKKEVTSGCSPFCWKSSTTMEYKAKSFLVTATTKPAKERLAKMRIQKAEQLEKQIYDWNLFSNVEEIEE